MRARLGSARPDQGLTKSKPKPWALKSPSRPKPRAWAAARACDQHVTYRELASSETTIGGSKNVLLRLQVVRLLLQRVVLAVESNISRFHLVFDPQTTENPCAHVPGPEAAA